MTGGGALCASFRRSFFHRALIKCRASPLKSRVADNGRDISALSQARFVDCANRRTHFSSEVLGEKEAKSLRIWESVERVQMRFGLILSSVDVHCSRN